MKAPRRAEVLRAIPEETASLVRSVLKQADARRLAVYLVGGPVRDLLLGREVTDVDLVVTARDDAYGRASGSSSSNTSTKRYSSTTFDFRER